MNVCLCILNRLQNHSTDCDESFYWYYIFFKIYSVFQYFRPQLNLRLHARKIKWNWNGVVKLKRKEDGKSTWMKSRICNCKQASEAVFMKASCKTGLRVKLNLVFTKVKVRVYSAKLLVWQTQLLRLVLKVVLDFRIVLAIWFR